MESSISAIQTLHFQLKNTHICIDVSYIDKIIPLLQLESLPNSPLYLVGLMNIEEKIIPVIDLAMRLGMFRDKAYTLDNVILLCTYGTFQAGLIVDKVIGLAAVPSENIQMHEEFNQKDRPFIGSVNLNENLSLLLNINYLFPLNLNIDLQNSKVANQ